MGEIPYRQYSLRRKLCFPDEVKFLNRRYSPDEKINVLYIYR